MKQNTMLKVVNPILGVLLLNQLLSGAFAGALSHDAFEVLHEGERSRSPSPSHCM